MERSQIFTPPFFIPLPYLKGTGIYLIASTATKNLFCLYFRLGGEGPLLLLGLISSYFDLYSNLCLFHGSLRKAEGPSKKEG
jgi:hypothetical protein